MLKANTQKPSNVIPLPARTRRAASAAVHHQQVICGKLLAFPAGGRNEVRPMVLRDTSALAPLLHALVPGSDIASHLGNGCPPVENFDDLHTTVIPRDQLSRQRVPI